MTKESYEIYKSEVERIIKNTNTVSVFLVGSTKNIDLTKEECEVNDIDIFVFIDRGENQVREIKNINGVEFDINYFSRNGFRNLINTKEYFFLNEMKDAKIIYDKNNTGNHIISICKRSYIDGPDRLSQEELIFMKSEMGSKIERLRKREKFDEFEYEFLTNLYLKDIIVGYFIINRKWVPKDKKLINTLKNEDTVLFELAQKAHCTYDYEDLLKVYYYVFKQIDIRKNIKIIY